MRYQISILAQELEKDDLVAIEVAGMNCSDPRERVCQTRPCRRMASVAIVGI